MTKLEAQRGVSHINFKIERYGIFGCDRDGGPNSLEMLLAAANGQKHLGNLPNRGMNEALANVIQGDEPWGRHSFLPVCDLGQSLSSGGQLNPAAIAARWNGYQRGEKAPVHISDEEIARMLSIARDHFKARTVRESLAGSADVLIENMDVSLSGYDRIGLNCLPALDCMAMINNTPLGIVALLSPLEVFYLFAVYRRDQMEPQKDTGCGIMKGLPARPGKVLPKISYEQAKTLVEYAREVTGLSAYFA